MLDRVADNLKKVVSLISARLIDISAVVTILIVLLVVADVLARRLFNAPIRASTELYTLGFSIIVFLPLAWCAIKDLHVSLDFLVNKFPEKARLSVEVVITFLTTIILGLMSWRILVQGTQLQAANQTTGLLRIPLSPFAYLAAFGSIMLTLAFFIKFIRSIRDITNKEERR